MNIRNEFLQSNFEIQPLTSNELEMISGGSLGESVGVAIADFWCSAKAAANELAAVAKAAATHAINHGGPITLL